MIQRCWIFQALIGLKWLMQPSLRMLETGSQSKDGKIRVKHLKTIEKQGNLFPVSRVWGRVSAASRSH